MSFRELRSFTEIMKSLGYPRLISMENFRLPNFELVAECLYWLVQRYYPGEDISDEISTESERVKFLQSVAQVMLTKARMKLNIKRLYSADGVAVKELLKVASLLYQATEKATLQEEEGAEAADFSYLKGFNPKEIKAHAAEIIKAGAALYDALGAEPELREDRARAVAGHVDSDFVENSIQEAISQVEDHIHSMEHQLKELEGNETTLDSKIDKKKQELERNEKRLSTLQSVRPAYMDEYEQLQRKLNGLYTSYLDKFRNLEYLEDELQTYYEAEQEKMEAQERRLKKMQKRLAAEELRILRGEQQVDETQLKDYDGGLGPDGASSNGGSDFGDSGSEASQGNVGKGVSKDTLRRPSGQVGGKPQIMGRLDGFDDDEASIDEDENSDGGAVSLAGDDVGGPGMMDQAEDYF